MMAEYLQKKKWIPVIVCAVVAILAILVLLFRGCQPAEGGAYQFESREMILEVGQTHKMKILSDSKTVDNQNVLWKCSDNTVATVDEKGVVTAVAGGEARITAVIETETESTSISCVVTVKRDGGSYSTYKLRLYTQKKDRNGYDVTEEVYEREIGTQVTFTEEEAVSMMPDMYVLNTEKSVLTGTVQEVAGACVIEVYYDVAEITYTVTFHYESAKKLGTYDESVTKEYTAYAFSKVDASDAVEKGFVVNTEVKGSVATDDSVEEGDELVAYCDRIRSNVKINYTSGKKSATYTAVYGVGLQNLPKGALGDAVDPFYLASYVDGKLQYLGEVFLKSIDHDITIDFKLNGKGFTYTKGGTIVNTCSTKNTSSYAYMQGSGSTVYLAATYNLTGSKSNTFGITLCSGSTSRELRFQYQGLAIMKDHTLTAGTLLEKNAVYGYNTAGAGGNTYVWAQNANGEGKTKYSAVQNMCANREASSHNIIWVVYEGILYANVDGQTVVRLPLTLLDENWTANKEYEIGFTALDGIAVKDRLSINNIQLCFGEEAESKLKLEGKVAASETKRMDYDVITGSYMPASSAGAAYLYGDFSTENTGISTEIQWMNMSNTNSAAGITIQVGENSYQYVIEGENAQIRRQANYDYGSPTWVTAQVKAMGIVPFNASGRAQVQAFVKDGYFYIFYNGQQAHCIDMQSLFPGYNANTPVRVGLYSWDANRGLPMFQNTVLMDKAAVNAVNTAKWPIYSEEMVRIDEVDFASGTIVREKNEWKKMTLLGSSNAWNVTGTMNVSASAKAENVPMGFSVVSGDKSLLVLGSYRGITYQTQADSAFKFDNQGTSIYAFNDNTQAFFGANTNARSTAFRALVWKDVLYVWFDGEICWRLPLTEERFGGFETGSAYKFSLYFGAVDGVTQEATASMTNLNAQMGSQVTGVDNLCAQIDTNVTKWSNSFTRMHIVGEKGESLSHSFYESGAVPTNGTAAFLNGSGSTVFMTADYSKAKADAFNFGITIRKGEEVRRVTLRKGGKLGIYTDLDSNSLVEKTSGNGIYLSNAANTIITTGGTHTIKWVIAEGMLYAWYQDELLLYIPMNQVHSGWTDASAQYEVGVGQFNPSGAGAVVYSADALYDENAKQAILVDNVTVAEATAKVVRWKDLRGMKGVGPFLENLTLVDDTGIYTDYAFMADAASAQYLRYDAAINANAFNYGVIIRSGSTAVRVVIGSNGADIGAYPADAFAGRVSYTPGTYVWVADSANNALSNAIKAGNHQMEWMIVDGTLYGCADGTMFLALPLNKLNSSWTAGGTYELGIANINHEQAGGTVTYTNINFVSGNDVWNQTLLNGKTVAQAIQLTRWSEISKMVLRGETANKAVVTAATTESHYAYLSGSGSNLYLSAAYQLTPSTNATHKGTTFNFGVVIRSGGVVRPVMFRKGNVYLGHLTSYAWSDPVSLAAYAYNTDKINAMLNNARGGEYNLEWMILDGALYAYLNEELILSMPLSVLNANWGAANTYEMGVFMYNPSAAGKADITVKQFQTGGYVKNPVFSAAYFNAQVAVDPLNGTVIQKAPTNGSVSSRFFLNGSSPTWEITGSMTNNGTAGAKRGGFLITTSDRPMNNWSNNNDYMFLLTAGCGFKMVTQKNANAWFSEQKNVGDFLKADATALMTSFTSAGPGTIYFKAVIQDDVLYVWFGSSASELVPGWKMPLTAANNAAYSVFAEGSSYRFGFAGTETNKPDFRITSVSTTVTTDVSSFG